MPVSFIGFDLASSSRGMRSMPRPQVALRRTAILRTIFHDGDVRVGEGRTGNRFVLRRIGGEFV